MIKSKFESVYYLNQIYRIKQMAIYFALFCLFIFSYLDVIRFDHPLLNEVLFIRLFYQLLPVIVILITSLLSQRKILNKNLAHLVVAFSVFLVGVGHAEILATAFEQSKYFPKVGMAIILYYAGILLALPVMFASLTCLAIITFATYAYLAAGMPTDEVISTTVFYVVFATCCIFMNLVSTKMLMNNIKLVKHINLLAKTDDLTQLNNRYAFFEHAKQIVEQSLKARNNFAIMIVDLDNFKKVNDSLGHQIGDEVLIKVAKILKGHCRGQHDIAARFGGDEFVMMLYENDEKTIENTCLQIISEIEQMAKTIEVRVNAAEVKLGASIGVTINHNNECSDINNLIEMADLALYEVKNSGKNSFRIQRNNTYNFGFNGI
jgi:diguanylate cyclase (GGDEF)-like protein